MLREFTLENFRNHRLTTLSELGPVTLFLGPNGAGKSSILEAIAALSSLRDGSGDAVFGLGSERGIPSRWLAAGERVGLEAQWNSGFGRFMLAAELGDDGAYRGRYRRGEGAREGGYALEAPRSEHLYVATRVGAEPRAAGASSYSDEAVPELRANGAGLASVFAYLQMTDPERATRIQQAITALVPTVRRVWARPARIERTRERRLTADGRELVYAESEMVTGQELMFDMASGKALRAGDVSDGTLVATVILTAAHLTDEPRVLLIDDVEAGLHPTAQRELMSLLRRLVDTTPGLQIIATSHSPFVVDAMEPRDVWVVAARSDDGSAVVKRLADHPEAPSISEMLSTGELWGVVGEDWVVDSVDTAADAEGA